MRARQTPHGEPEENRMADQTLTALIIGTGFAGLGMGVALRRAGVHDFVIVEKEHDVGGVWRDNSYPGAACDVPSHLYSFSFEPNPNWSRVFAPQAEILDYLRHCARKYELLRHIQFGAEVSEAVFDEAAALWRVRLADGRELRARLLVSGTGQLSRPALPALAGIDSFQGPSFHSARWNHDIDLAGKRVAVVGTGASAIQFIPAIAPQVGTLHVFQRSPAWMLPRQDRAYGPLARWLFRRVPGATQLVRAGVYAFYESRAIAFTRFKGLMKFAVGWPFGKMLAAVKDPALRARLLPDYPIGCKRLLLSDAYLPTLERPNVQLHTEAIARVLPQGIQTADGRVHEADVIVYGTGFAATSFLAPMRIVGRGGLELHRAWQHGASAYLGLSMPGFPNFFMLYGPNTNLGHNSIVYMIESQIAHVMRCLARLQRSGAQTLEVDAYRHERFKRHIHQRLAHTVWNGCQSWYVDAQGHSSTNWPGFTFTYRWQARHGSLDAYHVEQPLAPAAPAPAALGRSVAVPPPPGLLEAVTAAFLRGFLRGGFKPLIGPPFGAPVQRAVVAALGPLMPGAAGAMRTRSRLATPGGERLLELVRPRTGDAGTAILYLHGGAFCLGSPASHRSITTRLALASGATVHVPDYRLAPEHPHPAALEDALACWDALLRQGVPPQRVAVAGDSAGGALALALALALRDRGGPLPAALLLISPVTDPTLAGDSMRQRAAQDPMIREAWLRQGLGWLAAPAGTAALQPLTTDLRGLPPMLVQVGSQEILLSDSERLAAHARACGVACTLQVHTGRWHDFHLQALWLRSARLALQDLAGFARQHLAAAAPPRPQPQAPAEAAALKV
jgi:cation diffusion facilitator CzcD-associated flavoprotein CzcO/acetyl esterase/lipase